MTANIVLNFDLSNPLDTQLANFDRIVGLLSERGVSIATKAIVSNPVSIERDKGVYETAYLRLSGKKHIRCTKGQTDREATARKLIEIEYPDELEALDALVASQKGQNEHVSSDENFTFSPPSSLEASEDEDDDGEKLF
jgi:hypothetical protein